MGPTWGPSGADRTLVAPCWPHEPCYLGTHDSLSFIIKPKYSLVIWSICTFFTGSVHLQKLIIHEIWSLGLGTKLCIPRTIRMAVCFETALSNIKVSWLITLFTLDQWNVYDILIWAKILLINTNLTSSLIGRLLVSHMRTLSPSKISLGLCLMFNGSCRVGYQLCSFPQFLIWSDISMPYIVYCRYTIW